jgi:transposase
MSIMETMARKKPRARHSFTPEFKADIVAARGRGDRTVGQVAKDFDLTETAVRAWVKQAEIDGSAAGGGAAGRGQLTSDERAELARMVGTWRRCGRPGVGGTGQAAGVWAVARWFIQSRRASWGMGRAR